MSPSVSLFADCWMPVVWVSSQKSSRWMSSTSMKSVSSVRSLGTASWGGLMPSLLSLSITSLASAAVAVLPLFISFLLFSFLFVIFFPGLTAFFSCWFLSWYFSVCPVRYSVHSTMSMFDFLLCLALKIRCTFITWSTMTPNDDHWSLHRANELQSTPDSRVYFEIVSPVERERYPNKGKEHTGSYVSCGIPHTRVFGAQCCKQTREAVWLNAGATMKQSIDKQSRDSQSFTQTWRSHFCTHSTPLTRPAVFWQKRSHSDFLNTPLFYLNIIKTALKADLAQIQCPILRDDSTNQSENGKHRDCPKVNRRE